VIFQIISLDFKRIDKEFKDGLCSLQVCHFHVRLSNWFHKFGSHVWI